MHLRTNRLFLESAAKDFKRTGAVVPSSRTLANAMSRELAWRYRSPVRVLEVGAGTGRITEEIVRHVSLVDHVDIYEIEPTLANLIRLRIREDKAFRHVDAALRVHNKPIEKIERRPRYDFVISCLPFTNFHPGSVRDIFEIFRGILKPGGTCSFYEYIFVRKAARIMSGKPAERERMQKVGQIVREYINRYEYSHEVVLRNLPPAMVHHIRFTD